MARHGYPATAAAAAVVVLLTVARAVSAYVVPEGKSQAVVRREEFMEQGIYQYVNPFRR